MARQGAAAIDEAEAAGDELRQRPAAFLRQRGALGRSPRPRGGRPRRARALRRSMRPKPPATSCASARRPSCASAARSDEALDLAADGRGAPGRCRRGRRGDREAGAAGDELRQRPAAFCATRRARPKASSLAAAGRGAPGRCRRSRRGDREAGAAGDELRQRPAASAPHGALGRRPRASRRPAAARALSARRSTRPTTATSWTCGRGLPAPARRARPKASSLAAAGRGAGPVGAAIDEADDGDELDMRSGPSCASTTRSDEGLDLAADGRGAGPVGAAIDEAGRP